MKTILDEKRKGGFKSWVVVTQEIRFKIAGLRSRAEQNGNRKISWPELFLLVRQCGIRGLDPQELDMSLDYWENMSLIESRTGGVVGAIDY
jgi:hypothetical protein